MANHTCKKITKGCFRCELNEDEMKPDKTKKVPKATIKRVEAALDRAMTEYADYVEREVEMGGSFVLAHATDHTAFRRARVALLRLLREARRG